MVKRWDGLGIAMDTGIATNVQSTMGTSHGVKVKQKVHVGGGHHALEKRVCELLRRSAILLARHDSVEVGVVRPAALVPHITVRVCDDDCHDCPGQVVAVELFEQPATHTKSLRARGWQESITGTSPHSERRARGRVGCLTCGSGACR